MQWKPRCGRPGPGRRALGARWRPGSRAPGRPRRRGTCDPEGPGRAPGLVRAASCRCRCARRTSLPEQSEGEGRKDGPYHKLGAQFDLLADLSSALSAALTERPPISLADGDVIRPGFDAELDDLRVLRDGGKQYLAALQERERERTGIASLKVGYNKVFGYFLEVTRAPDPDTGRVRAAPDADRR